MQNIVANIDNIRFSMEDDIENQVGVVDQPFQGMDKSGAPICSFFKAGKCGRGNVCPYRHVLGERGTVCKHWLRGLCKKGDHCEFLHEYDMSKMPECYFYQKFGRCDNKKDCQYQHIDPLDKVKDCPWYDRGFCRHGPACKLRHRRRVICPNYLVGFCLEGPKCKYFHPKFELPIYDSNDKTSSKCVKCLELGGLKTEDCICDGDLKDPIFREKKVKSLVDSIFESRQRQLLGISSTQPQQRIFNGHGIINQRDNSQVTCFKCGSKGHYANNCNAYVQSIINMVKNNSEQVCK